MNLYLTADGRYVGTQAEAKKAGKGWTPETVPTDKEGLIDYLNALHDRLCGPLYDPDAVPQPFEGLEPVTVAQIAERGSNSNTIVGINPLTAAPDMTWKPTPSPSNPGRDLKLQQGRELTQITDYIMDSEGYVLGSILNAGLERAAQLSKKVDR
jgi:hypothetical protein